LRRTRLLTVADRLAASGGAEIAQLRVVEGLALDGWDVELLYVSRGDLWTRWEELATSTTVIGASSPDPAAPLRSTLATAATGLRILRSDAQVLYLHNPVDLAIALGAGRLRRTPVVIHLHLPPPSRQPMWLNRLIARADAVVTPSDDAAQRWTTVAGLSPDRVWVIPTGVDPDRFAPLDADARDTERRAIGVDPTRPVVLYAGRIDRGKGLTVLLDALRIVGDRVQLVLCGSATDAPFLDELHRASEDLGVTWLDRRIDVAPLMAAADLLVLPSTVPETQGMVVSEAMSCGTPAVASSVGGIRVALAGFTDHLVPPGDATALAEAIDRLVEWRQHTPDLGSESRRWVEDHFTLDRTSAAVSRLLDDVGRKGRR
jgi:glycosyltransferase involved in cell wall biosynthesis